MCPVNGLTLPAREVRAPGARVSHTSVRAFARICTLLKESANSYGAAVRTFESHARRQPILRNDDDLKQAKEEWGGGELPYHCMHNQCPEPRITTVCVLALPLACLFFSSSFFRFVSSHLNSNPGHKYCLLPPGHDGQNQDETGDLQRWTEL